MNVLEEILEEIEERVNMVENIPVDEDDGFLDGEECYEAGRIQGRYEELVWCRNIIRSHMDEWYQKGYEDSKKDNGWIPYTEQNMPKKEGVYLVTCDDEEYPVKRMRFKKEDEYCLWYDEHGIYDGVIFAWQPLPEPYKEE
jgi:hypothetical protein